MTPGLLRITVVAGSRRSDLAVPGGAAVADLLPDLARAVGLLDPAAVYAGLRLHVHGRRLRPDRGLREQGVADGALLAVALDEEPPPVVHDDVVEVAAAVVDRWPAWTGADSRRTTLAAGLSALALAPVPLGALAGPGESAAVALVLVVLAGHALPALAVACGVGRVDEVPVDGERAEALVERSARLLRAGSVVVAAAAVGLVPFTASGPAGAGLTADCGLVLLLRARRHRARDQALVDAVGGWAVLLVGGLVVQDHLGSAPVPVAAVSAGIGVVLCVVARLPAPPPALRARALDLVEVSALVALAPLLLLVTRV